MATIYDASYRPGLLTREDESHRAAFLEQSEGLYEEGEESTHQFGVSSSDDDDDDASLGPSDVEYSPTPGMSGVAGGGASMLSSIGVGAIAATSSVLHAGARLFYEQRQCVQMGEGPTLLRLLCFLGGLVMLISSILSIVNVFALLRGPSTYVLQLYQGFFGLITMIVEAKDWDCFDQFKPWMTEWFRFLTVPAGKGAFYLFVGSLGISLWVRNLFSFTVGLYMAFMGIICIAVHAGTSWKPPMMDQSYSFDQDYITDGYGNPIRRHHDVVNDALTAAFHDPEGGQRGGVYEDPQESSAELMTVGMMRRDTTTTSSGYSTNGGLRPGSGGAGVKNESGRLQQQQGNRYPTTTNTSASSLSTTIPMSSY